MQVYMKKLNNKDNINESVHEFYAQVKYMGKINTIQDGIQLKVKNEPTKLIQMPLFNSVVTVDIPDKQTYTKNRRKSNANVSFDGTLNNAKNTESRLKYEKEQKEGSKKERIKQRCLCFL